MKWLALLAALQCCVGMILLAHGVWGQLATHYAVWERTGQLLYALKPDVDRVIALMKAQKLRARFTAETLAQEPWDSSSAAERLASWVGAQDTWWTREQWVAGPVCLAIGLANMGAAFMAGRRRGPTA